MRFFLAIILLATIVSGQQVFRTFTPFSPATLDPQLVNHAVYLRFHAQIFESPVEMGLDRRGHCAVGPALCAMPEVSEDGLTIKLRVLPGARFHDDPCFEGGKGREVVPADIRYMLVRHADPSHKSVYWAAFLAERVRGLDLWRTGAQRDGVADYDANIAGLVVEGDTLSIRLLDTYPQFIALLSQPWASIIPREAIDSYGTGFGQRPIGTGPFRFKSKDALGTITLVKNPTYRLEGRPHLDEVRFEVVSDLDKRTKRFLLGDIHVLDIWPQNHDAFIDRRGRVRSAHSRKGIRLTTSVPLEISYLFLNFENKFLGQLAVRKAIALSLNRRAIGRIMEGPRFKLANSPLPTVFPESRPIDAIPYAFDKPKPQAARDLLAAAGYPGGKGLPEFILDFPGNPTERDRKAVERMKSDLARVGIRIQIRTDSWGEFLKRIQSGDSQIGWVRWYADYPDAENFLGLLRSHPTRTGTANHGMFANARYDALYDRMAKLYPGPERNEIITKMVSIVRQEVPWIFLFYPHHGMLVQKEVRGFQNNVLNFSLRDVQLN